MKLIESINAKAVQEYYIMLISTMYKGGYDIEHQDHQITIFKRKNTSRRIQLNFSNYTLYIDSVTDNLDTEDSASFDLLDVDSIIDLFEHLTNLY